MKTIKFVLFFIVFFYSSVLSQGSTAIHSKTRRTTNPTGAVIFATDDSSSGSWAGKGIKFKDMWQWIDDTLRTKGAIHDSLANHDTRITAQEDSTGNQRTDIDALRTFKNTADRNGDNLPDLRPCPVMRVTGAWPNFDAVANEYEQSGTVRISLGDGNYYTIPKDTVTLIGTACEFIAHPTKLRFAYCSHGMLDDSLAHGWLWITNLFLDNLSIGYAGTWATIDGYAQTATGSIGTAAVANGTLTGTDLASETVTSNNVLNATLDWVDVDKQMKAAKPIFLAPLEKAYTINFNTVTNQITYSGTVRGLYVDGSTNYTNSTTATINTVGTLVDLIFEPSTGLIDDCATTMIDDSVAAGWQWIGWCYLDKELAWINGPFTIDNKLPFQSNASLTSSQTGAARLVQVAPLSVAAIPNISTTAHTISWTGTLRILRDGNSQYNLGTASVTIPSTACLLLSHSTKLRMAYCVTTVAGTDSIANGWDVIGFSYADGGTAWLNGPFTLNGTPFPDPNLSIDFEEAHIVRLNTTTHRWVLPDTLWMLSTDTADWYLDAMVSNWDGQYPLHNALLYPDSFSVKLKYFDDSVEINANGGLPDSLVFCMNDVEDTDLGIIKKVDLVVKDTTGITPGAITWIPIGDSKTQNGQVPILERCCEAVMGSVTMFGSAGGHEGRGGWEMADYCGISSYHPTYGALGIDTVGTCAADDNPFIFVAKDTVAHPDWAYTYPGGQQYNLRYDKATDAQQTDSTFYTVDINRYLAGHGYDFPDVWTIALGTNDISQQSVKDSAVVNVMWGMWIFLNRINSCAGDSSKHPLVGIIFDTRPPDNDYPEHWEMIETIQDSVEAWQATLTDIDVAVLPVWPAMDRWFIYPQTISSTVGHGSRIVDLSSDGTHYGDYGRWMYAKAVRAWIVSKLF